MYQISRRPLAALWFLFSPFDEHFEARSTLHLHVVGLAQSRRKQVAGLVVKGIAPLASVQLCMQCEQRCRAHICHMLPLLHYTSAAALLLLLLLLLLLCRRVYRREARSAAGSHTKTAQQVQTATRSPLSSSRGSSWQQRVQTLRLFQSKQAQG
jgi:hypothetical protein